MWVLKYKINISAVMEIMFQEIFQVKTYSLLRFLYTLLISLEILIFIRRLDEIQNYAKICIKIFAEFRSNIN